MGKSYVGKYEGWDKWTTQEDTYLVSENKNGLYTGYPESSYFTDIEYPIKVGKSWESDLDGYKARITSVTKTVKTPAGTFKNCIEVTHTFDDGNVYTIYHVYFGILICSF